VALDLYAGSLTRYFVGDWLSAVAQAAMVSGAALRVVDALGRDREAIVVDPDVVHAAVLDWRAGLAQSLGVELAWAEDGAAPYETDTLTWEGHGAVLLLAAYDDRPDLRGGRRHGFWRREPDRADRADTAPAVRAVRKQAISRYPALVLGAEWWLPASVPPVFEATSVNGTTIRMGSLAALVDDLHALNDRTLQLAASELERARATAPPSAATVQRAAPFGLAVFTALAEWALEHRQPLVMDY
jgi:hypothetical protein